MSRDWIVRLAHISMLGALMGLVGCASPPLEEPVLAYDSDTFRAEIVARVPEISAVLARAPHDIDPAIGERARKRVMAVPRGPARVQALVDFLSDPKPEGLGLAYDWSASGTASATIERGSGNCVALASVLVGLGRSLDWPIFYAEARTRRPETQEFEEVVALSDHMAVLVVAKTVKMIIDFSGPLDDVYSVRPIDDLTAYAHILNNLAAQSVMIDSGRTQAEAWQRAVSGFELATRIEPQLGRAWNNLGIALSKLGHFDKARLAYRRAVVLDTAFGSAKRNLTMMETRALGATTILDSPLLE